MEPVLRSLGRTGAGLVERQARKAKKQAAGQATTTDQLADAQAAGFG